MAKKDFKKAIQEGNTAHNMIAESVGKAPAKAAAEEPKEPAPISKELKSMRYNLMIKPSSKEALQALCNEPLCKSLKISPNDLINRLIEEALQEQPGELIQRLYLKDYK